MQTNSLKVVRSVLVKEEYLDNLKKYIIKWSLSEKSVHKAIIQFATWNYYVSYTVPDCEHEYKENAKSRGR